MIIAGRQMSYMRDLSGFFIYEIMRHIELFSG
jgi:hypothetical protein